MNKDDNSEAERQPQGSADDGEGEEPFDWEMIADMYNNFRRFSLENKPHIKEYKKIRKMHTEIVGSMIEYHQNDKFEQKIDHILSSI